ncbi:MAG: EamA family transporter, partial [Myxococcales bacterium]|nr:EamA family transporter [Myxococcales bacterium]
REAAPALPYAALVYGASSLALAPLAVATSIGEAAPPSRAWLAVIGLALVPTLVGHTLAQRAARSATPLAVAMISPGETIGSIAIGAALLREVPSTRELAGAGLIVLGLLAAVTARRPPPAEPPPSK